MLTREIRIIELHVSKAMVVERLQFGLVGFGDVGEVFVVVCVDVFGVCLALLVAEMVPVWGCECEFEVLGLFFWDERFEVVELVGVGTSDVLDFSCADYCLAWLVAGLHWWSVTVESPMEG